MKIVLGMSGGVDSAAAAYLLEQAGHTVTGVTLVMYPEVKPDIAGAEETAQRLGISHTVLDCSEFFEKNVLEHFARAYRNGETPNPCIICNPTVKFAALLEYMTRIGYDKIATGHYADVSVCSADGRTLLLRGKDHQKDQSYMLYRLSQPQLSHTIFPLAHLNKQEIRALAEEQGLLPSIPKDSMDICFLPDGDYASYLERRYGFSPMQGDFLLSDGTKVGSHSGQWRYTVGQRKGLGLSCGYPVYVTDKDAAQNLVYVGREDELLAVECVLCDCNWISDPEDPNALTAKVRYSRNEAAVILERISDQKAKLRFDTPQRAITRGQSAVIYEGERVIGGGFIEQVIR